MRRRTWFWREVVELVVEGVDGGDEDGDGLWERVRLHCWCSGSLDIGPALVRLDILFDWCRTILYLSASLRTVTSAQTTGGASFRRQQRELSLAEFKGRNKGVKKRCHSGARRINS